MTVFEVILLAILVIAVIIVCIISVALYQYIYAYPVKMRKDPYKIVHPGYANYKEDMLTEIEFMDALPYEKVGICALDKVKLEGRLYYNHPGEPIFIFFHGYRACYQWDGYGAFKFCRLNNMNCLMVEQRAHGSSKANSICFGIKERYDCMLWAKYISDRFGDEQIIYLSGVSMGSATVMMASDLDLPKSVKGIIADCGYTSPQEILMETAGGKGMYPKLLMPFAAFVFRIFAGMSINASSAMKSVKNTKVPMLFIHGSEDDFVPLEMGKRLYKACNSKKDMLIIPNAGHAVGSMENYKLYEDAIKKFMTESA